MGSVSIIAGLVLAASPESLADCVEMAKESNLELGLGRIKVLRALAERDWHRSHRWYSLVSRLQGAYVNDRAGLLERGQSEFHLFTSHLGVGANVWLYGGERDEVKERLQARRTRFSEVQLLHQSRTLVEGVIKAYLELVILEKEAEVLKLDLETEKLRLERSKTIFRSGKQFRRGLLKQQLSVEKARAELLKSTHARATLFQTFGELLDRLNDDHWLLGDRFPIPTEAAVNELVALALKTDTSSVEQTLADLKAEASALELESRQRGPFNVTLSGDVGFSAIRDIGRGQTLIGPSVYINLKVQYELVPRAPSNDPVLQAERKVGTAQKALVLRKRKLEVALLAAQVHVLAKELVSRSKAKALSKKLSIQANEMERRGDLSKHEVKLERLEASRSAFLFELTVAQLNQVLLVLFLRIEPEGFLEKWRLFADKHQLDEIFVRVTNPGLAFHSGARPQSQ